MSTAPLWRVEMRRRDNAYWQLLGTFPDEAGARRFMHEAPMPRLDRELGEDSPRVYRVVAPVPPPSYAQLEHSPYIARWLARPRTSPDQEMTS